MKIIKLILSIIACLLVALIVFRRQGSFVSFNNQSTSDIAITRESTHDAIPFPDHGTIISNTSADPVAPFTISTPSGDTYFLVILKSSNIKIQFYLHPEKTFESKVPLGTYDLYFASGQHWYGDERLFGLNSNARKADTILVFSADESNTHGHELHLQQTVAGNLGSKPVDISDLTD